MKAAPVDLATGTLTARAVQDRHAASRRRPTRWRRWCVSCSTTSSGRVTSAWRSRRSCTTASRRAPPTSTSRGSAPTSTPCSPRRAGRPVNVINDADAAGLAEMRYGAGRGRDGVGDHVHVRHRHRVGRCSSTASSCPTPSSGTSRSTATTPRPSRGQRPRPGAACRGRSGPSGSTTTSSASCSCSRPTSIIVGGGVSRKADRWLPHIDIGVEIVPAALTNDAGIVGAALDRGHAANRTRSRHPGGLVRARRRAAHPTAALAG